MEQLQHHGITGTVPKHVLSDNMKNFTAFPLSAPADDGFIHLLGKGICSFPNNCSMTFRINAPYHFFYVYEGTLSVTDALGYEEDDMLVGWQTGTQHFFRFPVPSRSKF